MNKKDFSIHFLTQARAAFLVCIILVLFFGTSRSESKPALTASRQVQGNSLSAEQILADPGTLHQRLKAKNPGYNGRAQFGKDPVLGLVGDFNGSRISDFSPLAGIPFGTLDLRGQGITSIEPLKGMSLKLLGIEDTRVADLTPLTGMKLEKLYLNNTPVTDLKPLEGMPLNELMLAGSKVKDLKPLRGTPLQALWLNNTLVRDISPLAGCPLISLTLEGTPVADLKPLAKMTTLKRLHIAKTGVSDLTPLKSLKLQRLIFTPENIRKGMDVARNMKTLTEVGTTLETRMPPEQFWSRYDIKKGE